DALIVYARSRPRVAPDLLTRHARSLQHAESLEELQRVAVPVDDEYAARVAGSRGLGVDAPHLAAVVARELESDRVPSRARRRILGSDRPVDQDAGREHVAVRVGRDAGGAVECLVLARVVGHERADQGLPPDLVAGRAVELRDHQIRLALAGPEPGA